MPVFESSFLHGRVRPLCADFRMNLDLAIKFFKSHQLEELHILLQDVLLQLAYKHAAAISFNVKRSFQKHGRACAAFVQLQDLLEMPAEL